ncbi:MAG: DEAD/DEAH box helicase, partial [Cellulomonadaceae bacterium]
RSSGRRRRRPPPPARVAPRVPRVRSVPDRVGGGAHAGTGAEELRGMDTARFFTAELPELTACAEQDPDLVVVVLDEAAGQVDYRFSDEVEVRVSTSPRAGSRDWFDLEVFVRAGEQEVPFAEVFRALAAGEGHLLLRDGLHFSLADERFARLRDLIDEARALQDTMGGGLRVHRVQAAYFAELEALGVIGEQADSWRAALGALVHGGPEAQLDPPAGLRAAMRPYQQAGYEWLAFRHRHGLGGVLADDMGLGKTVQALALVQHAHERVAGAAAGTGAGAATAATAPPGARLPFLVVAPTSVVGNWVAEARQFTPDLGVVAVHETRARRRSSLAETVAGADVVVTSYALFRLDFEEYAGVAWGGLILDEAQFVKNYRSVTYQCVRRLDVPVRFALTGTPLENDLMELWSILSIVAPGLFPHPGRFAEYYARPIEREGNADQLARLRRRIAPFLLRRTKEQVAADLPAKQEQVTQVVLNPRHRKAYDRYLQRERAKVLGIVDELDDHRFEVFRSLTVLRQAALDVSLVDEENASVPSSKLDELFEMLEDILAEGHSVLVFSQFTRFLRRVRDHLDGEGVAYSYLDGRTRRRTETIERFASGQTSVFLISLKAGGFGLNLTAADYCILLDPWWNPAAEAQAVDRAHRIGQTRTVMVYRMVSTDTIEDKVMTLKAAKSSLFGSVFDEAGSSEAGSSEAGSGGAAMGAGGALTAADVRELLA